MSMAKDHQKHLQEKKQKPLTPHELYLLSTIYRKNSPLKELLIENRAITPLPECFGTFSAGSAYDVVPEGEQQFAIPKKGTKSHYIMKELTPELLQRLKEMKDLAKQKQAASKKTGRYKDAALKTVRKSKRLADRANKIPDAPKKKLETSSPGNAGLHTLISEMKGYREEIIRYLDRLDSGKMFDGNIARGTLDEFRECHDTIRDYRSTCKASLAELLEACGDGPVYQSIYEEFLNTVGKRLMDWENEVASWVQKKQHPEAPTPQVQKIGETPGLQKDLSSEENYSHAEIMRCRASLAPRGALDFDSDESTPKGQRYIREGDYLLDSAAKRTAKRNTPDHRIRLTVEEEEAARQRAIHVDSEEVISSETSQERDERLRVMADEMDACDRAHEEKQRAEKQTEPELDDAATFGIFSETEHEQSKETSVDQNITGNTVREREVENLGSEQALAADGQVDRPRGSVLGATALSPKEVAQKTTEGAKKSITSQPAVKDVVQAERERALRETFPGVTTVDPTGFGNSLQQFTLAAIGQTITENQKRWEAQERKRVQQELERVEKQRELAQREREQTKARLAQQQLQMPAIVLYDLKPEEVEEVKSIILRESQKRNWHPEDAHRLVQRFLNTGKFPAEFVDIEYIQKFRQPAAKRQAVNKPVADETTSNLKIPVVASHGRPTGNPVESQKVQEKSQSKLSEAPEAVSNREVELVSSGDSQRPQPQFKRVVLSEEEKRVLAEKVQAEVVAYGKLETERSHLADMIYQD